MTKIETITAGNVNAGTPIPGVVGWTYEDAASEAKRVSREHRLFGNPSRSRRRKPRRVMSLESGVVSLSDPNFQALTGWTPEAALEMYFEIQRENRIFGSRHDDLHIEAHDDEDEVFDPGFDVGATVKDLQRDCRFGHCHHSACRRRAARRFAH